MTTDSTINGLAVMVSTKSVRLMTARIEKRWTCREEGRWDVSITATAAATVRLHCWFALYARDGVIDGVND